MFDPLTISSYPPIFCLVYFNSQLLDYLLFKLVFIGIQLLYKDVLVSTVRQLNQLYVYTSPFGFPSHLGQHSTHFLYFKLLVMVTEQFTLPFHKPLAAGF